VNTRTRDLLLIATAMLAILSSGFGLGSAFAPPRRLPPPPEVPLGNVEEATLSNLREALQLTPAQEDAIRADLSETSDQIRGTRREALLHYHLLILDLHDRIGPKLDPAQQETLRKNRQLLQATIEKRFESSLDDLRSALGNKGS
jgi:hypothetical protein